VIDDQKKKPLSVLLLDFAQQSNSGDDVMQRALIKLTNSKVSKNIVTTSYFGSNEFDMVKHEFSSYQDKFGLEVVGGFFTTNYKNRADGKVISILRRAISILSLLVVLVAIKLNILKFFSKIFLNNHQISALKNYIDADIVIWNGRNFRGNTGSGQVSEFMKVFELCGNPLVCMFLGKPVYCVGASVWPMKGRLSKYLMGYVSTCAKRFWLREQRSFKYMQEIVGQNSTDIAQMPDLSFYELNDIFNLQPSLKPVNTSSIVALTLVGKKEINNSRLHRNYIDAFSELVSFISEKGFEIRVIPQVTYDEEPYESELMEIIKRNPKAKIVVVDKKLDTEGLLYEYCNANVLVASRMHSAIFAVSAGLPVTAVCYDCGAKWGILDDIMVPHNLILTASSLTSEKLINNFEKILVNSSRLRLDDELSYFSKECEKVFDEISLFNKAQ